MSWLNEYSNDNIDIDNFEYVVQCEKQAKVCFGSGQQKKLAANTLLVSTSPDVGPGKYDFSRTTGINKFINRTSSTRGVGTFAKRISTLNIDEVQDDLPAPNTYKLPEIWKNTKRNIVPFNQGAQIRERSLNSVPGVGSYELLKKTCRRVNKQYNFGNPQVIHTVEILCRPFGYDTCGKCLNLLEKDIEYWHRNYTIYLCTPCLLDEKDVHKMYSAKELKLFKKARHCRFMHKHEGTFAFVNIVPERSLRKLQNIEDRLSLYLHIGNETQDGPSRRKIN